MFDGNEHKKDTRNKLRLVMTRKTRTTDDRCASKSGERRLYLKSSKSKRISPFVFSWLFLFQQHNQLTSEIFPTNGKTPVAGQPDSVLDKNQQRKIDSGFPSADSLSWSRLNRNACRTRQQHRGLVLIGTQLDIERTHANTQVQLWGTRTQLNESTNTTSWPPPRGLLVLFFRIKSIKFQ